MNSIDYNVFNLSLENALNNHAISSGKDYIILLKSPVGANVQVRLNSNQGDLIPLKENYAIKAKDIKEIFISADIVPGGTITIGQSNSVEGFEIITAPTVNEIEEIGKINSFDNALLDKLDKIINPYVYKNKINSTSSSQSITTLYDAIADFDMMKVILQGGVYSDANGLLRRGYIKLYLDDQLIATDGGRYSTTAGATSSISNILKFDNLRGRRIKVIALSSYSATYNYINFHTYNLKG